MVQFKYISSISCEELNSLVVIPCLDEENFSCVLIKNATNKTIKSGYSTDNLDIKLNRVLTRENTTYFFHIIKIKKNDEYSRSQFETIYNYIFKKITEPQDDIQLSSLITSLEDFFKTTPERDKTKIQTGVFGELFTIKFLYDNGYKDIVKKFHTNFYSKHDVEISKDVKLEIKSTLSEKRIHHFKHNQISRTDVKVYVSSVLLEEAKEGVSLSEMFDMISSIFVDPDAIFALKKLRIKCGITSEDQGLKFSLEKAKQDIKFYDAKEIPQISTNSNNCVTNIEYDSDLSAVNPIAINDFVKLLLE